MCCPQSWRHPKRLPCAAQPQQQLLQARLPLHKQRRTPTHLLLAAYAAIALLWAGAWALIRREREHPSAVTALQRRDSANDERTRHAVALAVALHAQSSARLTAAVEAWAAPRCVQLSAAAAAGAGCLSVDFLYFSSELGDGQLPQPSLALPRDTPGGVKTQAALHALAIRYPSARYYMKADDDTAVVLEQLLWFLESRANESSVGAAVLSGAVLFGDVFASGGAGYVLSPAALRGLLERPCTNGYTNTHMEDVMVSLCLQQRFPGGKAGGGLLLRQVPGMFMSFPDQMLAWHLEVFPARAIAPAVSLHHIPPEAFADLRSPAIQRVVHHIALGEEARSPRAVAAREQCTRRFAAAGWGHRVWGFHELRLEHFWHLTTGLDEAGVESVAGVFVAHRHGGVWVAGGMTCSLPGLLETLGETVGRWPSEPSSWWGWGRASNGAEDRLSLRPSTFEGRAALLLALSPTAALAAGAARAQPPGIAPSLLACTRRSLLCIRLLLWMTAEMKRVGAQLPVDLPPERTEAAFTAMRGPVNESLAAIVGRPGWHDAVRDISSSFAGAGLRSYDVMTLG